MATHPSKPVPLGEKYLRIQAHSISLHCAVLTVSSYVVFTPFKRFI